MSVRTASEHVSNLPEFVTVGHSAEEVDLRCPRCDGEFTVNIERFTAERRSVIKPDVIVHGRSCPYCQVTALPPAYFRKKVRAPVKRVRYRPPRSKR